MASDKNANSSDLLLLREPFHWVSWTDPDARDVSQLPMWVGSTADGGSVLLFADEGGL